MVDNNFLYEQKEGKMREKGEKFKWSLGLWKLRENGKKMKQIFD